MTRKQLAHNYKISDKTFRSRLKVHGLYFGSAKVLLPEQVLQIIEALGWWEITLHEP